MKKKKYIQNSEQWNKMPKTRTQSQLRIAMNIYHCNIILENDKSLTKTRLLKAILEVDKELYL